METIKGYIQEQPDMKFTPSGKAVTNLYLSEIKADENSRKYRIIAWEMLAEAANQLLESNDFIYVKGYWKTRTWESQDGQSHSRTELIAQGIWKVGEDSQPKDIMEITDLPVEHIQ